jgi:RNA polymerase primary sigma factor
VVTIAKKYQNLGLPLEDLINEGNIGLIKAAEKFDLAKGCHFISYAVWWIRQSILKALSQSSRTIRLPMNKIQDLLKLEKAQKRMASENDRPDLHRISQELMMDEFEIERILKISRPPLSFNGPLADNPGAPALEECIVDTEQQSQEDHAFRNFLRADIERAMRSLTKREAAILRCRFGLNDACSLSLREIGRRYGLSKERIRQLELKSLNKLRYGKARRRLASYQLA